MITRRSILRGLVAAPAVVAASSLMPVSARNLGNFYDLPLVAVGNWFDPNLDGIWMSGYDLYGNKMCEFVPMVSLVKGYVPAAKRFRFVTNEIIARNVMYRCKPPMAAGSEAVSAENRGDPDPFPVPSAADSQRTR